VNQFIFNEVLYGEDEESSSLKE